MQILAIYFEKQFCPHFFSSSFFLLSFFSFFFNQNLSNGTSPIFCTTSIWSITLRTASFTYTEYSVPCSTHTCSPNSNSTHSHEPQIYASLICAYPDTPGLMILHNAMSRDMYLELHQHIILTLHTHTHISLITHTSHTPLIHMYHTNLQLIQCHHMVHC